jgi:hypothetical protein
MTFRTNLGDGPAILSPAQAGSHAADTRRPPAEAVAEAGGYGSHAGFADDWTRTTCAMRHLAPRVPFDHARRNAQTTDNRKRAPSAQHHGLALNFSHNNV